MGCCKEVEQMGNLMKMLKCNLYDEEPYIAEKDGKYHVLQGCFKADNVRKWYNTKEESIYHWNNRVKSMGD